MATIQYKLTQSLSNNTQKSVSFALPQKAGTYRLSGYLDHGKSMTLGTVTIDNTSSGLRHKLTINIAGQSSQTAYFYTPFGLYSPQLSDVTFSRDIYSNAYYGSVTVTNPNTVSVNVVVWYKTNYSENVNMFSNLTLNAGQSQKIAFSDIYSEGLLARIHFVNTSRGINENEVFAQTTMGQFKGTTGFYGVGEETTTTTTTTTTQEMAYQAVDSDGNFTLWRKIDVE